MSSIEQTAGADVYAARIVRTLNSGFTTLMISIGHRARLFDVMAAMPAATSAQIADAAGLSERYVREWLAAMTTARIVEHDPKMGTYVLPPEYAAVLTRSAGASNLATLAQFLPLLASAEDLVLTAFRSGGGVQHDAYARFDEVMGEERKKSIDADYIDALLALMPGMRERLTRGGAVLDAGCGRGHVVNVLARMFPRTLFRGYDLSRAAIAAAREEADDWGLRNTDFEVCDVAGLDDELNEYDLVLALDAIHDQAFPRVVLRNIASSLRPDGVFLMQDIAASSELQRNLEHPFGPMLYTISAMHCMPVSLGEAGEGLGTMWGEERARQLLREAGFTSLRFERLAPDALNYYCVATRA